MKNERREILRAQYGKVSESVNLYYQLIKLLENERNNNYEVRKHKNEIAIWKIIGKVRSIERFTW